LNHEGREGHEGIGPSCEAVGREIVDADLKVHKALGPGLLESAYEHCLAYELGKRGLNYVRQAPLSIVYEGVTLDAGYRLDLLVEDMVIVEVKASDPNPRLFEAQLITYLKLSRCRLGYLMNFNVPQFRHGIRRFVL
jgi:GxxExxY protein